MTIGKGLDASVTIHMILRDLDIDLKKADSNAKRIIILNHYSKYFPSLEKVQERIRALRSKYEEVV